MAKIKCGKNRIILVVGLVLLLLALIFDLQIYAFIQTLKNPVLDTIFSWLLFFEGDLIFYPFVIALTGAIIITKNKKLILPYIISLCAIGIVVFALKFGVGRYRPNMMSNHSFPSGHAALLFSSIPFFKNKTLQRIWLIVSCVLVFIRLYFGLHYLGDVIAGALIGYFVPLIVLKISMRLAQKQQKNEKKSKKYRRRK